MGDVQTRGVAIEAELSGYSLGMALDTIRDWITSFETVGILQAELPSLRAAAEARPDRLAFAVRAAVPALATIYHPRVVHEIVAVLRGAEMALTGGTPSTPNLEGRVQALEQIIAGAGAVLASPLDPFPDETPDQRLEVLEATVTGAGAVLRSLGD